MNIKKLLIIIQLHLFVVLFCIVPPLQAQENDVSNKIAGWVECAVLASSGIEMIAKLDSGADNSSLNVAGLFEFKRDGSNFIRFDIVNYKGQKEVIEAEVVLSAARIFAFTTSST